MPYTSSPELIALLRRDLNAEKAAYKHKWRSWAMVDALDQVSSDEESEHSMAISFATAQFSQLLVMSVNAVLDNVRAKVRSFYRSLPSIAPPDDVLAVVNHHEEMHELHQLAVHGWRVTDFGCPQTYVVSIASWFDDNPFGMRYDEIVHDWTLQAHHPHHLRYKGRMVVHPRNQWRHDRANFQLAQLWKWCPPGAWSLVPLDVLAIIGAFYSAGITPRNAHRLFRRPIHSSIQQ